MLKKVAILLAVWQPREDWLIELLDSLDRQTYQNLCLYVRDDASPTYPIERLERVLKDHITRFPFVLHQNEQNRGSNYTFEELVRDAGDDCDYIAFCDQDDVWLPEKIKNTVTLFETSPLSPKLVCANVSVMDGDGKEIAAKMEDHRQRHIFQRGTTLAPELIHRNFVMGCTVIMERKTALSYLPFPNELVHDHYLAFRAAAEGAIDYLEEPQMRYRVYGGNQTGVMTGVQTKDDYYKRRIEVFRARVDCLCNYANLPELTLAKEWCDARCANFKREKGGFRSLWRTRKINKVTSLFELFALRAPMPLFRLAVRMIQKGVL